MRHDPVRLVFDADACSLAVSGELSDGALDRLRDAVAPHTERDLTVDLSAVTYLPSAALGILVSAQRRATRAGGSVHLRAAPDTIAATVLRLTGMEEPGR